LPVSDDIASLRFGRIAPDHLGFGFPDATHDRIVEVPIEERADLDRPLLRGRVFLRKL
jgi:hypothetical protein